METSKMCHGDCIKCSYQQRVYCASYMARNNYAMMEAALGKIEVMQGDMAEMKEKINAIQSSEVELVKPFAENESESKKKKFETIDTMGQAV